jgi:Phage integrase family
VRLHDLRHSHATHMLAAGIHPKIASERLGHSKVGITLDLYSHVMPGMQAEAAAAVDGAMQAAQQRRTQMLANRLQSPSGLKRPHNPASVPARSAPCRLIGLQKC